MTKTIGLKRQVMIAALGAALAVLSACSAEPEPEAAASPTGAPVKEAPVTIKMMANFSTANISEADKAFFQKVEEANNVKLEFTVPPSSGYQEQLQLMMVSGDHPDVVFFPGATNTTFLNAVNGGMVIPLNSYLEKAPNIKEYSYEVSLEGLKVKQDGNIYGIPRTTIARNDHFIVRKDWLDKLGYKIPDNHEVSIDQFTEILRKFTQDDPDGNGKKDTYGFAAHLNSSKVLTPVLSSQWGYMGWQPSKGEYGYMTAEYDRSSGAYKDLLAYTQKLYKEGLLDPDSAVNDSNAALQRFKKGITGVLRGFAGHVSSNEAEMKALNPQAELTYLFVQNQDGKVQGATQGTALYGLWGITKSAKHPEKIIQVMDWLLSDEGWDYVYYGMENVDYKVENGIKVYDPNAKAPWRQSVVRRARDGDFFIAPSLPQKERDMIKPWVDKAVESVIFSQDRGYVPPASKKQAFLDYKLTWDELVTKIMIGERPVEDFDKVLADWYKHGGEEYVKEMNEFIASIQ
ncbi:MAG: hypothetical protein K0R57_4000 [Paenibacillaceae bacterium]|jgi:putative aldouronate transport system substrate-binding protein|nr:hypothetical protein [Paenibacillaceae bacterium]